MTPGYLLDEHLPRALKRALGLRGPGLEVWRIGDPGAPPRGTPDPVLLDWCETNNCILITNNRKSMPTHLAAHVERGRTIRGILVVDPDSGFAEIIEQLDLVTGASFDREYENQIRYLPLA